MGLFGDRRKTAELDRMEADVRRQINAGQETFPVMISLLADGVSTRRMGLMLEAGKERLQGMGLTVTGVQVEEWRHVATFQVEQRRVAARAAAVVEYRPTTQASHDANQIEDSSEFPWIPDDVTHSEFVRIQAIRATIQEGKGGLGGLPIGQRLPDPGEFHVVWQAYRDDTDRDSAERWGVSWIEFKTPWDAPYLVISSDGSRATVYGASADSDWTFYRNERRPGEFLLLWDAYIEASSPVEAKQEACRQIESLLKQGELTLTVVG
jgi:hypothetical protein